MFRSPSQHNVDIICTSARVNVWEEIKRGSRQMHHHQKWEISAIMKDDIYVFILYLKWKGADVYWWIKFCLLWHNCFKWANIAWNRHLLSEDNICKRLIHFISVLTEVLQYGYEGLIKAAKQNFNTFLNAPLVFCSPSLFECFLKVFNLHPNAVPLFNWIYNADADAIWGVSSPRKRREK